MNNKNYREKVLLFLVCFAVSSVFAVEQSSFLLVNEMKLNFSNGYYSLALNQAEQLEKKYPDSKYEQDVLRCKAFCYYKLGRKSLCRETLELCTPHYEKEYLNGVLLFEDGNFEKAKKSFESVIAEKTAEKDLTASARCYLAESLSELKKYKEAIPQLLKLIGDRGYSYQKGKATKLLCECFYKTKNYGRTVEVYEKVAPVFNSFDEVYARKILLLSAISCDAMQEKEKAKQLYQLFLDKYSSKKDEGLDGFWVRMGIEAFKNGDMEDCKRCFEVAEEKTEVSEESRSLMTLYRAAIVAKSGDYRGAIKALKEYENDASVKYHEFFISSLLIYSAEEGLWKDAVNYGKKLESCTENKESDTKTGEKTGSASVKNAVLPGSFDSAWFWYAKSLEQIGNSTDAKRIYQKIDSEKLWAKTAKAINGIDYSFAQIYAKNQDSITAYENYVIEKIRNNKTDFLEDDKVAQLKKRDLYLGLGYYIRGMWSNSLSFLEKYLNEFQEEIDKDEKCVAKYYLAQDYFQLQKNESACENFAECAKITGNPYIKIKCYYLAAQCTLALGKDNPEIYLEKIDPINVPLEEKIEPLILLSNIYISKREYSKSENLLSKYCSVKPYSSSTDMVNENLAQVYRMQDKIQPADKLYDEMMNNSSDGKTVERACYKKAQLYFDHKDWEVASARYYRYRKLFSDGSYYVPVCYENAICQKNIGNPNLAILLLNEGLESSAQKNEKTEFEMLYELMKLYRNQKDYKSSVETARKIMKKFPDQANQENIKNQVTEISLIVSGEDEKTAELETRYMNSKMNKTPEGRNYQVQLALRLLSIESRRKEGYRLCENFIETHDSFASYGTEAQSSLETENYADALCAKAGYLRSESEYEKSAQCFLDSAAVYARFDKEKAAKAMYCACEAFDCARQFAECKAIYDQMKTQFADSVWTKRTETLTEMLYEN